jgi:hypothetical protein
VYIIVCTVYKDTHNNYVHICTYAAIKCYFWGPWGLPLNLPYSAVVRKRGKNTPPLLYVRTGSSLPRCNWWWCGGRQALTVPPRERFCKRDPTRFKLQFLLLSSHFIWARVISLMMGVAILWGLLILVILYAKITVRHGLVLQQLYR